MKAIQLSITWIICLSVLTKASSKVTRLNAAEAVNCAPIGRAGRSSCQNLYLTKSDVDLIRLSKFKRNLKDFIKRLRPFIKGGSFDHICFESKAAALNRDFVDINKKIKELVSFDKAIDQFKFTKRMFLVMMDAANYKRKWSTTSQQKHALVYRSFELECLTLIIRDSRGRLNLRVDKSVDKIFEFYLNLRILEDAFQKEGGQAFMVDFVFKTQTRIVEETLQGLWMQIPSDRMPGVKKTS